MNRLFISYAPDGQEFAVRLHAELEELNPTISAWLDRFDIQPGENWRVETSEVIKSCSGFIFVITRGSVEGQSRRIDELTLAVRYNKPIIPVRLHADATTPSLIATRQEIDFTHALTSDAEFKAALARLITHLRELLTPEEQLQILRARLDNAEREQQRANYPSRITSSNPETEQLKREIQRLEEIVSSSRAGASAARSRFINPSPARVPSYFQNRQSETSALVNFLRDPAARLMTVVGPGGSGKTALVCRLLNSLESGQLPDGGGPLAVDGIVYLSARGTHPINAAYFYLGLTQLLPEKEQSLPKALFKNPELSFGSKTEVLLSNFAEGLTVVLLDGLDSLMQLSTGLIRDNELDEILRVLLELPRRTVKVILTTRVRPHLLGYLRQSYQRQLLLDSGLASPYAENLLREMDADGKVGLRDAPQELLAAAREHTGGNPAALEAIFANLSADPGRSLRDVVGDQTTEDEEALDVVAPPGFVGRELFERLSFSSRAAFRTAEGIRARLRADEITTEILLAALFMKADGPTQKVLTLFASAPEVRRKLEELLKMSYGATVPLNEAPTSAEVDIAALPVSDNLQKVLEAAASFSARTERGEWQAVRTRHLLAALLSSEGSVAGKWLEDLLGVRHETLSAAIRNARDFSSLPELVRSLGVFVIGDVVLRREGDAAATVLAFSPNGEFVAAGYTDLWLVVWHAQSGEMLFSQALHEQAGALAFSPDGSRLVVGDTEGHLRVWELSGAEFLDGGEQSGSGAIRALTFSPHGRLLVAVSGNAYEIYEADALLKLYSFGGVEPLAVCFSTDGKYLRIATRRGDIQQYPVTIRDEAVTLGDVTLRWTDEDWVAAVPLGGEAFLAVRGDGVVTKWIAETAEAESSYKILLLMVSSEIPAPSPVLMSPSADGRYVAGVASDLSFKVWSLDDGREVFSRPHGDADAALLALAPDARTAAVAFGNEVRLLRIPLPAGAVEDEGHAVEHAPPKYWVLVAGSSTRKLRQEEEWFGRAVGRALAHAGFGLVGGGYSGIDHVVARSFADESGLNESGLSSRLVRVIPETIQLPSFDGGTVVRVPDGDEELTELVRRADAVILIGGVNGTRRVFRMAERFDKPVFPLAGTGRAAAWALNEMLKSADERRRRWVESEAFKGLSRIPFTEAEAEEIVGGLLNLLRSVLDTPPRPARPAEPGQVGANAWYPRLTSPILHALGLSEALRRTLDEGRISTKHLLYAMSLRRGLLLQVLSSLTNLNESSASLSRHAGLSTPVDWSVADSIDPETLLISRHARQAMESADEIEGGAGAIGERHFIAGLLSLYRCSTSKWLTEWLGLPAERLRQIFVENDSDEEIVEQLRRAREEARGGVGVRTFHLDFAGAPTRASVGDGVDLQLRFANEAAPASAPLKVPANCLELTAFVEAPGFQQESPSRFTLPVVDGAPVVTGQNAVGLIPLVSGEQSVTLTVYGGKAPSFAPAVLKHAITVAPSEVLPPIPELTDSRLIPGPQPSVVLYVAHEEEQGSERLRMYLTCRALGVEREPSEALSLDARELAALRHEAARAAARTSRGAPRDVHSTLAAFGSALFERLFPKNKEFRRLFLSAVRRAEEAPTPWPWLVISDERAALPWELLCPRPAVEARPESFLGGKFPLSHWVGRQRLHLTAEAPVLKFDILHYKQRPDYEVEFWRAAVGGGQYAEIEEELEPASLLAGDRPFYGLHVVRYEDARRSDLITEVDDEHGDEESKAPGARALVRDRQLDFTLRRPVVGLSLVRGEGGDGAGAYEFEREWALPFLRAGASALVGPRWPVLDEADQLFFRAFYRELYELTPVGLAAWRARVEVGRAFPHRTDWLAYAHFGHPLCAPYAVESSEGFILFEAIGHPEEAAFDPGLEYSFRASYRAQAPSWYGGRLQFTEPGEGRSDDAISVVINSLLDMSVQRCDLERVPASDDYQQIIRLRMPEDEDNLPLVVRFRQGRRELQTLMLNLAIREVGR